MPNIVYVLINPAMSGYVKIGRTKNIKNRMRHLNTGAPERFECAIAVDVAPGNASTLEKALHKAFTPDQAASAKEFFKMDPERVVAILREWPGRDVTPTTRTTKTLPKTKKRPPLHFPKMGIPIGSTLVFRKTGEKAVVVGDKKVQFRGKTMSLTAATRIILEIEHSIQPTPHWTFGGHTLQELYDATYGPRGG
ncbi:MAG: GIY-YIG nuclease family protein [Desulfurellaceae bacterium]|nr:GIY-YIG nuclease family protein [Desulfurellaceae bacterium]